MSKRAFRDRSLPAAVFFLAGIGATAFASYLAMLEKQRRDQAEDAHRAAEDELALYRGREKNRVVQKAEGHIRALLRGAWMSESDRMTDTKAAQKWLYDYGEEN
jgi:ferredoxin-NADP reductase